MWCRARGRVPNEAFFQSNPLYDQQRINPFVFDIVKNDPDLPVMLSQHSFGAPSIVSLIFVLSAIPPQHHRDIFAMLTRALPIGGTLCFRDFAHGDLCQVRFHQKASAAWCEPSLLSEKQDYYRRGDGTFAYFFNVEEIRSHAESVGLQGEVVIKEIHGENRKTGVQLHRRFVQGRWNKVR
jgi:methyltransferase-like protein 6